MTSGTTPKDSNARAAAGPGDPPCFQRGQLNLDTLVWREGMAQWAALRQVVDELGLQTLADASTATASGGFDLRGDYAAIDNGTTAAGHRRAQQLALQRPGHRRCRWPAAGGGGEVVYAGFWKRVAAYMIDYFVLAVPGGIIGAIIGVVLGAWGAVGSGESSIEIVAQLASALINLVIGVAYTPGSIPRRVAPRWARWRSASRSCAATANRPEAAPSVAAGPCC